MTHEALTPWSLSSVKQRLREIKAQLATARWLKKRDDAAIRAFNKLGKRRNTPHSK